MISEPRKINLRELALHILDIAENSISANADKIRIVVEEDIPKDVLRIVIEDNGKGMDQDTLERVIDLFVTSRTTRKVGLGIPFFKSAAEACGGTFKILSEVDGGTKVEALFKYNHIDRMPLGNIIGTMLTLIIGSPEVNWLFEYQNGKERFIFDDEPIKQMLGDIPLSDPMVLKFIRTTLEEGIRNVQKEYQTENLFVPTRVNL